MDRYDAEERARIGHQVEVDLVARSGKRERLRFDLVPDHQADIQHGFLGEATPLGQALLGEAPGILIPCFTDELMAVEIISIRESSRQAPEDAAAQRADAVQNAKDQIDFTNAVLFAASVDTKWGAYDADGLNYKDWKAEGTDDEEVE